MYSNFKFLNFLGTNEGSGTSPSAITESCGQPGIGSPVFWAGLCTVGTAAVWWLLVG